LPPNRVGDAQPEEALRGEPSHHGVGDLRFAIDARAVDLFGHEATHGLEQQRRVLALFAGHLVKRKHHRLGDDSEETTTSSAIARRS
jgi:hypothetical protein